MALGPYDCILGDCEIDALMGYRVFLPQNESGLLRDGTSVGHGLEIWPDFMPLQADL
jgi:hypothetical protein